MSFFGRNIKKIRNAKKISQTSFADLFKLKRGSIGAYEEGRAEAKIDTVIEIANYFKLSLDQLLKKELTINEIYHLNELSQKIEKSKKNAIEEASIPVVLEANKKDFIHKFDDINFLSGLQSIKIPGLLPDSFAFEYTGNSLLTDYAGIIAGDICVTVKFDLVRLGQPANNQLFVVLTSEDLLFGRIVSGTPEIHISFDNPACEDIFIEASQVIKIWRVYKIITSTIPVVDSTGKKLKMIDDKIEQLLNRE